MPLWLILVLAPFTFLGVIVFLWVLFAVLLVMIFPYPIIHLLSNPDFYKPYPSQV